MRTRSTQPTRVMVDILKLLDQDLLHIYQRVGEFNFFRTVVNFHFFFILIFVHLNNAQMLLSTTPKR